MTRSYYGSDRTASYSLDVSGTGGWKDDATFADLSVRLHLPGAAGRLTVMQPPLDEISPDARCR